MKNWRSASLVVGTLGVLLYCGVQARAEERKLGWAHTGELSFVLTAGNTETSTLGFKNTLTHLWERSGLTFNAGAVRAESKALDVEAVGTRSDFRTLDGDKQTTAAIYYYNGRYDRKITDRFFWYVGAGWDRNKGAGVRNRYIGEGGVGNLWVDTPTFRFQTDYALTYTKQKDYVEDPDVDDSFVGARVSYDLMKKVGATSTFTSKLIVDDNLETSQDYRADMINSLAVAMSTHLALKVSVQWLYDNKPASKDVPLRGDPDPVQVELDNLDTILTASVVANF